MPDAHDHDRQTDEAEHEAERAEACRPLAAGKQGGADRDPERHGRSEQGDEAGCDAVGGDHRQRAAADEQQAARDRQIQPGPARRESAAARARPRQQNRASERHAHAAGQKRSESAVHGDALAEEHRATDEIQRAEREDDLGA
jgi:hypothetical protein